MTTHTAAGAIVGCMVALSFPMSAPVIYSLIAVACGLGVGLFFSWRSRTVGGCGAEWRRPGQNWHCTRSAYHRGRHRMRPVPADHHSTQSHVHVLDNQRWEQ